MQRDRRFASIAIVAVVALGGVSACRSEPAVAAYIGKAEITQARVDAVYADAESKLLASADKARVQQSASPDPSAPPVPADIKMPIGKAEVLTALIGADVLTAAAKATNAKPVEVPVATVSQQVGLPEDAEYVTLYSTYRGYLATLIKAAKPGSISEVDLHQVYDRLKAAGGFASSPVEFAEFSSGLGEEDRAALAQSVGLRDQLKDQAATITVNPRYGVHELPLLPVELQAGKSVGLIGLPLTTGDKAVVDAP
jgi:hypothetical protein